MQTHWLLNSLIIHLGSHWSRYDTGSSSRTHYGLGSLSPASHQVV